MDPFSHPSRPAGAPEFVVFSHKQNERVSLFCRPTLWRFAEVEFDPWVSDLTVNQRFIELDKARIPVALAFENNHASIIVVSKSCLGSSTTVDVQNYADDNGLYCEILDSDFLKAERIRFENYLLMLSYINKQRDALTERNLREVMKLLPRQGLTVSSAMQAVEQSFGEKGAALVFELVRKGRLNVKNLRSTKLSGAAPLGHGSAHDE